VHNYYRKKLSKLLGVAINQEFFTLLWATHALQSDYSNSALRFFNLKTVPKTAVSKDFMGDYAIHPWEIETLANEMMTVKNSHDRNSKRNARLDCSNFFTMTNCVNILRKLDNAEYKAKKSPKDIMIEMGRIAARQFEWQRGYFNIAHFYRNIFVYGQGDCAKFFLEEHGISIDRFSHIGFMFYVALLTAQRLDLECNGRKLELRAPSLINFSV
jgi:hypothetical protein